MFGYATMEELNKVPSRELFTKESYTAHRERAEKIKRWELGPRNYEINIIRKNGETRNLSVTRGEVLWNGAKQFQIIYEDITDIKTANEALQLSKSLNFKKGIADAYWYLNYLCQRRAEFPAAFEYAKKAFDVYNTINDEYDMAWSLSSIGTIYADLAQYNKSLDYHLKSLEKFEKIKKN